MSGQTSIASHFLFLLVNVWTDKVPGQAVRISGQTSMGIINVWTDTNLDLSP